MLKNTIHFILMQVIYLVISGSCQFATGPVDVVFQTKHRSWAFNTNQKWHLTKKSTKLSEFDGNLFFLKNFTSTNCENCARDDCTYSHKDSGTSGIVSFWYAIYTQKRNSDTIFKFGTKFRGGNDYGEKDYWKFAAKNTDGKWKHKSICLSFYGPRIYFVFYTNVSNEDEVGISNISFTAVKDCFPSTNFVKCSFEEPDLCHWTVAPRGVQWIKTNVSEVIPMSRQNDSFLVLKSKSNYIGNGQLYSPSLINNTSYLKLSFWYYIHPSDYESVTQLKIAVSQYNEFRWIFESDIIKSTRKDKLLWQRESLCTHVKNVEPVQFVFQGTIGVGSQIAIDDIKISECVNSVTGSCFFDRDICGWQMDTLYSVPWVRIKSSSHIPSRPNGSYYLRVVPTHTSARHARLFSPLLAAAPSVTVQFWYYTDGSNESVTLSLKTEVFRKESKTFPVKLPENPNANWMKFSTRIENIIESTQLIINAKVDPEYCLAIDDIVIDFDKTTDNAK